MALTLKGTSEENFKKLEIIIPRMAARMTTKSEKIIPDSMVSFFCYSPDEKGLIFRFCTFSGKVKKLCFTLDEIVGSDKPAYKCKLTHGLESRSILFETKKKSHVQALDFEVSDGDIIEFYQTNENLETIQLKNIHVSILLSLSYKDQEVIATDLPAIGGINEGI